MVLIDDGKGRGYKAEVNKDNELVVRSIAEFHLEDASHDRGDAYSWDSTELNIDIGDTMLFVQNTSDKILVLDRLILNGSNVICTWDVGIGSATTTPTGTVVTAVNLNRIFSAQAPDATSFSDETAVADASLVFRFKTPIDNTLVTAMAGIVLGKNHYIQVNQETESTSGSAILIGHFEEA